MELTCSIAAAHALPLLSQQSHKQHVATLWAWNGCTWTHHATDSRGMTHFGHTKDATTNLLLMVITL